MGKIAIELNDLMKLRPEDLAKKQHDTLKAVVIEKLENIVNIIAGERYKEIGELCESSPAGDGYGRDNMYIDFSYNEYEADITDVVDKLMGLKKIAEGVDNV